MKKISFIFVLGLWALSFNAFSQINVSSTGKVGIDNTSPGYQLDVSGNFKVDDGYEDIIFNYGEFYSSGYASLGDYSDRWYELYAVYPTFSYSPDIDSDINLKKDIKDLTLMKDKLSLLRPVEYKLKERKNKEGKVVPLKENKYSFGFIAQEMEKIFPDIVTKRESGTFGIRYTELIPVLVKALQEQQTEIDGLKARIEKLESAKN